MTDKQKLELDPSIRLVDVSPFLSFIPEHSEFIPVLNEYAEYGYNVRERWYDDIDRLYEKQVRKNAKG
jgi:hypothetical protein